jgi:hypothetical protein
MPFPPDLGYYGRLARGIYDLARSPMPADGGSLIRTQLENRETRFLETLRQVVFGAPDHPYQEMFRLAGCSFADFAQAVQRDGLEPALQTLHRAGVWLSHDEFKGKKEIVRSGRRIEGGPQRFRNPLIRTGLEGRSGGSRSPGTPNISSAAHKLHNAAYNVLYHREHGLAGRIEIIVKPVLPAADGLSGCLRSARLRAPAEAWFSPAGHTRDSVHYRWATYGGVAFVRMLGHHVPFPAFLPGNDFTPVARHIAQRRNEGVLAAVRTHVSPAVRIAAAALEHGLDIRETVFLVGGEALTDAKRAVIQAAGAEVFPRYTISEIGPIGYACRRMNRGNAVHLFHDSVAVATHRRLAPLSGVQVNSLLFTPLLPSAPYVLLNAEMDDAACLEPARCDCTFQTTGFHRQLSEIASFGKLTGQGMTLVGTDIVRLLEEALPRRFGGRPGDYQLVEREGPSQTQLSFRVSPRVTPRPPEEIKDYFLSQLRKYVGGAAASRIWQNTEALEVVWAEPLTTRSGKVLPLHLLGNGNHHAA